MVAVALEKMVVVAVVGIPAVVGEDSSIMVVAVVAM